MSFKRIFTESMLNQMAHKEIDLLDDLERAEQDVKRGRQKIKELKEEITELRELATKYKKII